MKRVFIATCMAAACAIGLSAQQPSTSTSPQSGRRGGPMTVTGCVKAGDTSGTYMLTNIQHSDTGGGSGATTTTGAATTTAGGQGMGRGMGQLMLNSGAPNVDLSAHVGHKVEVTGMMSGGRGRMAGGGATTTDTGAGSGSTAGSETMSGGQAGHGMRSMTVTSVKMIASSCSE